MAEIKLKSKIVTRIDTASNWTDANPVLLKGEMGIESDTGYLKYGDGSSAWTDLPYMFSDIEENEIMNLFK